MRAVFDGDRASPAGTSVAHRCCIMSTKSKRRAARRATQEELILGEIMGGLLSAITFGALEPEESEASDDGRPNNVHSFTKRQSHAPAARSTNAQTFAESRRVVG
jgi:hypothetical protein